MNKEDDENFENSTKCWIRWIVFILRMMLKL